MISTSLFTSAFEFLPLSFATSLALVYCFCLCQWFTFVRNRG